MDRSLDSIGSCSLDVDADSFEISDTSGSINPVCPKSMEDISKDLNTNRKHGFSISYVNQNDSPLVNLNGTENGVNAKPSYLNLACCVNGYSNLTTYDSKIRQDLNKSREVSPIRPSCNSIPYCKKMNSLAPPVLLSFSKMETSDVNKNYNNTSGSKQNNELPKQSFVQQRVELLYGPGALVQNFFSPRKLKTSISPMKEDSITNINLRNKIEQLSSPPLCSRGIPSQSDFNKESLQKNFVDLPVLRHLNEEFRAQLPIISPKKYSQSIKVDQCSTDETDKAISKSQNNADTSHVIDITPISKNNETKFNENDSNESNIVKIIESRVETVDNAVIKITKSFDKININSVNCKDKNGLYFLNILKQQQLRLLLLADNAEKKLTVLSRREDISDNTLGLLRAASGKARLLVSQKMKQFEGLCNKNLNETKSDSFPTTNDDLQGFWDMVCLQINDIDSSFKEIDLYEQNDWKKPISLSTPLEQSNELKKTQKKIIPFKSKSSQQKCLESSKKVPSEISSALALKRESQRKQLLEMKRKQRMAMIATPSTSAINSNDSTAIEIFIKTEDS